MSSRLDAAAEDRRRLSLDENATASERLWLVAGQDARAIVVKLDPTLGGDLIVSERPVKDPRDLADPDHRIRLEDDLGPNPSEQTLKIVQRIKLRGALGLPRRDCASRRPREGCYCLQAALDELADSEPTKAEVQAEAKRRHKEFVTAKKIEKRQQRARLAETERLAKEAKKPRPVPVAPPPPEERPAPRVRRHPRWRREPADPLSPWAFRHQSEITTREIMTKQF